MYIVNFKLFAVMWANQLQLFMRVTISHRSQSILYIGSGTCDCALFFMFWLLADNRFFHVWRSVTVISPLRKFNWNNSDFITPTVSCWSGSRSCAATGTLYKNSRLCWLELGLLGCPWDIEEKPSSQPKHYSNEDDRLSPRHSNRVLVDSIEDFSSMFVPLKTRRARPSIASRDHTVQQDTVRWLRSPCFCSRACSLYVDSTL